MENSIIWGWTPQKLQVIWNLRNLRHLRIDGYASFDAPDYKQEISGKLLSNLRTMLTPILKYRKDSEEILRRLPRLEKLKCIYLFKERMLPRLDLIPQLGFLKLFSNGPTLYPDFYERVLKCLPSNLKRLSLSVSLFGWWFPMNNAIEGSHWEMEVGDFPNLNLLKLDTLDLEVWSLKPNRRAFLRTLIPVHGRLFPSLKRLELQKYKKLKELPAKFQKCVKLKEIKVKWCNPFLQDSARRIMGK
ncbi:hypothetical protein BC332_26406 [Capsicum chinense]|nr:hypothetical protein BC332_26406 [Capsicum chinense]